MATTSAKDTFESETFAPTTFASGAWRGVGVSVTIDVAGGQLRIPPNRPGQVICQNKPGQRIPINRPGQRIPGNDDL